MRAKYYQVNDFSKLKKFPFTEGNIYLCTNGSIFYDPIGFTERKELTNSGIIILKTEEERNSISPENNKIYFVIDSSKIYSYFDNSWNMYSNGSGTSGDVTIDSILFHTDMLVVNDIGGIKAGDNLDGLSVAQVLNKLIYPYVKPIVRIVAQPINGGIFEKGDNKNIDSVTVTVTKKSELIKSIEIFNWKTLLHAKEDESIRNGGSYSFNVNIPVDSSNVQINTKVTDMSNNSVTSYTNSFNFVYPYYTGITKSTVITQDTVKSMKKMIVSKSNKSVNYTANNDRMVFAYPKSYGKLKTIIDQNNFDVTASFTCNEINITGLDNTSQPYYIYCNDASTVTDFKMQFNY